MWSPSFATKSRYFFSLDLLCILHKTSKRHHQLLSATPDKLPSKIFMVSRARWQQMLMRCDGTIHWFHKAMTSSPRLSFRSYNTSQQARMMNACWYQSVSHILIAGIHPKPQHSGGNMISSLRHSKHPNLRGRTDVFNVRFPNILQCFGPA